ncbi:MAG: glycerol-3-phosphate dehydrogenase/oxidase [Bacteroidia bacterium]|nr:glycerol-3-phosphate dehydrogenase/oxidase [Bacteroidia bacterium]
MLNRAKAIESISKDRVWDLVIVGGGSTGLGVAIDAISRGYSVALLEKVDFAKGTSSRSTKLVHGGVRYLAQGDVFLVMEALKERGRLLKNAPHLTRNQSFVIPVYTWFDLVQYTVGLTLYDLLAGGLSLGRSHFINKEKTLEYIPTINPDGLKGGVVYYDGQFDDSRLALSAAQTAAAEGAAILNHFEVKSLLKDDSGKVEGVEAKDLETGKSYKLQARAVVNATGVFVDDILQMDAPAQRKMIRPSQGVHVVLDRSFLPSDHAIMIPKTSDGRVLFCVPWHDKVVVGTTDTLLEEPSEEPKALEKEIDFILETAQANLAKKPQRSDVLATFAGLRPLAAPKEEGKSTKEISRSHKVLVSESGLLTVTGGKWTTFRKMGEDTIEKAVKLGRLERKESNSVKQHFYGYSEENNLPEYLRVYGTDVAKIRELEALNPQWSELLHPDHPYTVAQLIFAIREEGALTVEDFLARRIRLLFLDSEAAVSVAPKVAQVMATELGKDASWIDSQIASFLKTAESYQVLPPAGELNSAI